MVVTAVLLTATRRNHHRVPQRSDAEPDTNPCHGSFVDVGDVTVQAAHLRDTLTPRAPSSAVSGD
jgi:hypothetical protein